MSIHSLPVEAPMHSLPHPGRNVRQDYIESLGLTIGEAAEALDQSMFMPMYNFFLSAPSLAVICSCQDEV